MTPSGLLLLIVDANIGCSYEKVVEIHVFARYTTLRVYRRARRIMLLMQMGSVTQKKKLELIRWLNESMEGLGISGFGAAEVGMVFFLVR